MLSLQECRKYLNEDISDEDLMEIRDIIYELVHLTINNM